LLELRGCPYDFLSVRRLFSAIISYIFIKVNAISRIGNANCGNIFSRTKKYPLRGHIAAVVGILNHYYFVSGIVMITFCSYSGHSTPAPNSSDINRIGVYVRSFSTNAAESSFSTHEA